MAKPENKLKPINQTTAGLKRLEEEADSARSASEKYMKTIWDEAEEKEKILLGKLDDSISINTTKSQVYDPRLSTILFERAARVMSQVHVGKAQAVSKDDIGKNKLMNMTLDYYTTQANEQQSMLNKLRLLNIYSNVYGSMFGLVPWRVDSRRNYYGPEFNIIPLRDAYPQPGVSLGDAEWFGVENYVSLSWLKAQDKKTWINLDEVIASYKDSTGDSREDAGDKQSYVERTWHTTTAGAKHNPRVRLFSLYTMDRWITLADKKVGKKTQSRIVRVVENPYPDGMLPIIAKHSIPLQDRAVGLGEFERGGTLQKGINSLINLYLDGVKYSIFPPLQIDPSRVVRSSIKWGAGRFWFTDAPNQAIQATQISPQGMNTFTNTYGLLLSALQGASGTTTTSESDSNQTTLGKTPQAIQFMAQRQNSRDEWDRQMQDDAVEQIYTRWANLISHKAERPVIIDIFGKEIEELQQNYPDVVEMFDSKEAGTATIDPNTFRDKDKPVKFNYKVVAGSSSKRDSESEGASVREILAMVTKSPGILQQVQAEGKQIKISELLTRTLATSGIQDWDKIIVDVDPAEQGQPQIDPATGQPIQQQAQQPQPAPQQQVEIPEMNDPEIQQAAEMLFRTQ